VNLICFPNASGKQIKFTASKEPYLPNILFTLTKQLIASSWIYKKRGKQQSAFLLFFIARYLLV